MSCSAFSCLAQVSSATDDFEVVRATVDQWLSSKPKVAMSADAVYETLNDGNPDNDPFIVSVRNPSHYALGSSPWRSQQPFEAACQAKQSEAITHQSANLGLRVRCP